MTRFARIARYQMINRSVNPRSLSHLRSMGTGNTGLLRRFDLGGPVAIGASEPIREHDGEGDPQVIATQQAPCFAVLQTSHRRKHRGPAQRASGV
jgi:hypothetical protein